MTLGLPPDYGLRAPTPDDLDAVAAVLVASDLADSGESVLGADFLRDEWSRPDFDLAADAWVVVHGGDEVVGYGQAMREEPAVVASWGVVHPGHRGRGIGAWLLDRVEERASELLAGVPAPRFRHAVNAGDRAAAAMLRARGLRPVRHFWHMQIELAAGLEPGPAPEGVEIGGIDPRVQLPAVHAVIEEAFADDWGHHLEPFDRWADEQTGSPSYDPTLWLLATAAGSRWAPSPPTCRATTAGWTRSACWRPGGTRDRGGAAAPLVRHVRGSRAAAGPAERRRRQPDGGDQALRACGHAGGEPVGHVGAPAGRPPVAASVLRWPTSRRRRAGWRR